MTIAIGILMLLGYLLIASEHITHINKAAIAVFVGVVGWILFMCTGTHFITQMHGQEFADFVTQGGIHEEWSAVQQFIARHVFLHYSTYICQLVMYIIATLAIVDVLATNGCFDFISVLLRSRSSKVILWGAVAVTFLISANLDNLTTSMLMMLVLSRLIRNDRQRLWVATAVVIAANCGGCLTVIGDITSLMVWTRGAVTPGSYSGMLIVPCLLATIVPTALISRRLPESLDLVRRGAVYDGDDSTLSLWQRIVLFIIGMGGLWFVPTFYSITMLPPFLGALCVLVVLWVINEAFHARQLATRQPMLFTGNNHRLQYETIQVIFFVIGITLSMSVLVECGAMQVLSQWLSALVENTYLMSAVWGMISSVLDNVALVMTSISMYDVAPDANAAGTIFAQNGQYWQLVMLSGVVGGCLLPIGNTSGYALMRMEGATIWWYIRHVTLKVLAGWVVALAAYFAIVYFI